MPKTIPQPLNLPHLPTLEIEFQKGYPLKWIAGVDEVGRGCIAGPVVAGVVVLPRKIDFVSDSWLLEIQDSKLLKAPVREKLAPLIQRWAAASAIGVASVAEIEKFNIFHASHLAMIRAIEELSIQSDLRTDPVLPDHILIDGKFLPQRGLKIAATAVIKGDQKCISIAAASILAKVWRDQHMYELDQQYPGYGLAKHKGYPTAFHAQALKKMGASEIHRRSFHGVN